MTYCVYEDLVGFDEVKIHLKSCRHYVDHEPTETTKWHEVDDYKAAEILAEQISKIPNLFGMENPFSRREMPYFVFLKSDPVRVN